MLLDLDGTLLDLAYDNYVWMGRIPDSRSRPSLSIPEAQAAIAPKFRAWAGKLEWYSIDSGARTGARHRPGASRGGAGRLAARAHSAVSSSALPRRGKRLALMTNAHPSILEIKHARTGVLDLPRRRLHLARLRRPKEDPWVLGSGRAAERGDPARTLFVDDSAAVLLLGDPLLGAALGDMARARTVRRRPTPTFESVDGVADLAEGGGRGTRRRPRPVLHRPARPRLGSALPRPRPPRRRRRLRATPSAFAGTPPPPASRPVPADAWGGAAAIRAGFARGASDPAPPALPPVPTGRGPGPSHHPGGPDDRPRRDAGRDHGPRSRKPPPPPLPPRPPKRSPPRPRPPGPGWRFPGPGAAAVTASTARLRARWALVGDLAADVRSTSGSATAYSSLAGEADRVARGAARAVRPMRCT